MDRLVEIVQFIERDRDGLFIESMKRHDRLMERLMDVINTYKPGVIVKAGLGRGPLLYDLAGRAGKAGGSVIVVEPSFNVIKKFSDEHRGDPVAEKIQFINGAFNDFPIDYYKADLLVCVDYFDFLETGRVIDEFRRAMQFDAVLFLGTVVLEENDIDGVYDDFMHAICPIHNDYYLEGDLKTFLDLNEFQFLKGQIESYPEDLDAKIDFCASLFVPPGDPRALLKENAARFESLYRLKDGTIDEPYYVGVFMREKSKVKI